MNFVLDASAILATILNEKGGRDVFDAMPLAVVSAVNLSEVFAKLLERDVDFDLARQLIETFEFDISVFDADLMLSTAKLRPITKSRGLSFADRACVALALKNSWPILTSDRRMSESGPSLGIDIRMIR